MPYTPRPYQIQCLDAIEAARKKEVTRQLVVMATGLGKTFCVVKLMERMGWPKTFGFMHREELLNQAAQAIREDNPTITVGIEKAGNVANPATDRVVLASIQTIGRKDRKRLSAFDPTWPRLVWHDESHHAPAAGALEVFDHFKLYGKDPCRAALLIGTTATPDRLDELGYDKIFDDVVFRYGLREAIRDKWLADIKAWRMESDLDLSGVKVRAGDFAEGELAQAVKESDVDSVAAKTWSDRCRGQRSLFFCVDKEHAHRFSDLLKSTGAKLATILDDTPARDRRAAIDLFKAGELEALVNVGIATEGFDAPEIQNIHILRPTKSRSLYTQCLGRGTRKTATKDFVTLYDYTSQSHDVCGIGQIFGLPDAWDLQGQSVAADADKVDEIEDALGFNVDGARNIADLVARVKGRRIELIRGMLSDSGLPSKLAWIRPSQNVERWVISWRNETMEGIRKIPEQFRAQAEEVIRRGNLWGAAERVEIFKNELGHYEARLHVDQGGISREEKLASMPSLSKLVSGVEGMVKAERPHKVNLLLKDRQWRSQPSTDPQKQVLRRKGVPEKYLGELSKGDASSLINLPDVKIRLYFAEI